MEVGARAGSGRVWNGCVSGEYDCNPKTILTGHAHSSAEDKLSGETVAIKMVTRVFDKLQLAKRALREITLLRHFSTRGHENVTGLIDLDAVHPDFTEMYASLDHPNFFF
jgi:hypothetical protein